MPSLFSDQPFEMDLVQFLGAGLHVNVWKVGIDGEVYAHKMVRQSFAHTIILRISDSVLLTSE